MFTLTDAERSALRCAHYIAATAVLTFTAVLQITDHLPTGVLLP
jgi:hypothetical protein